MKNDYYERAQAIIDGLNGIRPKLLLHSCCAPCSSSVIAALARYFEITVFYYNPNIEPRGEYERRRGEQIRFLSIAPQSARIGFLDGEYENALFKSGTEAFANEKEGGARCSFCYGMRIERTAQAAADGGFDFFTTTLSVSPYKDADKINAIGARCAEKLSCEWLWSDFKKKDGYKKSIELSKQYNLYRQTYCGCERSLLERLSAREK